MHKFVARIKEVLDTYDAEKKNESLLSKFFSSEPKYIQDLRGIYDQLKNNDKITMYDLLWFYKDCYRPTAKYAHLEHADSEEAGVYLALKADFDRLFPAQKAPVGKRYKDAYEGVFQKVKAEADSSFSKHGKDSQFYSYDKIKDFQEKKLLSSYLIKDDGGVVFEPYKSIVLGK